MFLLWGLIFLGWSFSSICEKQIKQIPMEYQCQFVLIYHHYMHWVIIHLKRLVNGVINCLFLPA